ncbi:MAG: hypothetical protein ACXVCX_22065 [Ktedonobacterales bacterium]
MWPFDIFAKRRAAKEAKERAEHAERMDRVKESIEAANKRQRAAAAAVSKAQTFRAAARQTPLRVVPASAPMDAYTDPLSPINPLSPLNPLNQVWPATDDEPRHSSSHCDSASTGHTHDYGGNWSFSDHGSSHSHDHGCSSSSYDSGSSSSSGDM